jgi:serine/threonine protein kinase
LPQIKPNNVLIFRDRDNEIVAKISDFGASVQVMSNPQKLPVYTRSWSSPESTEVLTPRDLPKTDVFSYGLLCCYTFLDGALLPLVAAAPESLDRLTMESFQSTFVGESKTVDGDCMRKFLDMKNRGDLIDRLKLAVIYHCQPNVEFDLGAALALCDATLEVDAAMRNLNQAVNMVLHGQRGPVNQE